MPQQRSNPYGAFNFTVEIAGSQPVDFMEVTGLGLEVGEVDYRSGSEKDLTVRKLAGLVKYTNVTLKRGVTGDPTLFDWMKSIRDGRFDQREVVITMMDEARQPVIRWTLHKAWPVKWTGPSLNAKADEVAVESLELAYQDLSMDGQK